MKLICTVAVLLLAAPTAWAHDDATVYDDNLPSMLAPSSPHTALVVMRNTGTSTWTRAAGHRLVKESGASLGGDAIELPPSAAVAPGQIYAFRFSFTAPPIAGNFHHAWVMEHAGVRFGAGAPIDILVREAPVVDASTLDRKILWGYQGWFYNDPSLYNRYGNWVKYPSGVPDHDCWPDVSEYEPSELFDAGYTLPGSPPRPAQRYSATNAATVDRHFKWMRDYGLDGVFVQRFLAVVWTDAQSGAVGPERPIRDTVLANARAGAERHGRVFANMYDLAGSNYLDVARATQSDWMHLVDDLGVTSSGRYIQHRGRPVVGIYGFGTINGPELVQYQGRSVTAGEAAASEARAILSFFHSSPTLRYRATVFCSIPQGASGWQFSASSPWHSVIEECDLVGPWPLSAGYTFPCTGGAERCPASGIDFNGLLNYKRDVIVSGSGTPTGAGDLGRARTLGHDYMGHIFPGFSMAHRSGRGSYNSGRRRGGESLWRQVYELYDAYRNAAPGARMLYGAMFDEFNECSQIMKTAPRQRRSVPATTVSGTPPEEFLGLDRDGTTPRSDHYLRVAGEAARMFREERPATPSLPADLALPYTGTDAAP